MFEASVNGDQYDPSKWANFYKPYGLDTGSSTQATTPQAQTAPAVSEPAKESVAPVTETVVETPAPVVEESTPAPATATESADAGKKSADDILNMIRNRQS